MKLLWTISPEGDNRWYSENSPIEVDFEAPALRFDGRDHIPSGSQITHGNEGFSARYEFESGVSLVLTVSRLSPMSYSAGLRLETGQNEIELNAVRLFRTPKSDSLVLGSSPEHVRILTEAGYSSTVRYLDELAGVAANTDARNTGPDDQETDGAEPNTDIEIEPWTSVGHWLAYDRETRHCLLAGFTTAERWEGRIELTPGTDGPLLTIGFDGGDTILPANSVITLESMMVAMGDDPFALLESYATHAASGRVAVLDEAPVSWCSWYPYRLSVSEERVLANARIAAERLLPYGMSIIEADLGWEEGYLPSAFEENSQFPGGLGAVAARIEAMGMKFGVWKAPFTVSEFDPVVGEHPEWLIRDDSGKPIEYWTWFWEPHGAVYILDLTQPGAQDHLRSRMESLYERGVRYFKPDFISCARNPIAGHRNDRTIVAGGGTEMARIGARIINEALHDSPVLNCGGPDIPGTGAFPLLYACNDTGNTGCIDRKFFETNFHSLACHLFKNRIWGILQPSCLCVGLPGTLEEARLRATVAYLTGGQIDISDDLTTLPEDRWDALTATLPAAQGSATPVDLFDPIASIGAADYTASCADPEQERPVAGAGARRPEIPAGSVWHLHVEAAWDDWELLAFLNYGTTSADGNGRTCFEFPLERVGVSDDMVAYEFWSGCYCGSLGDRRTNPKGTDHPGDLQELFIPAPAGTLRIEFAGPAVKLVSLRKKRNHPWIVGTTFHQSSGAEITDAQWDPAKNRLSATIERPAGATGAVVVDPAGRTGARVSGGSTVARSGARGSLIIPVTMSREREVVEIEFE